MVYCVVPIWKYVLVCVSDKAVMVPDCVPDALYHEIATSKKSPMVVGVKLACPEKVEPLPGAASSVVTAIIPIAMLFPPNASKCYAESH